MKNTILLLLCLWLCLACEEAVEHTAPPVREQDSVSVMRSYGVNTLISDSGVIKYRIVAEQWDVNTVKQPSRWEFMKGIFFEQFDEKFHVEGYIQADTAWYYDQQKLWKLRGRVHIRNVNGLVYTGEELYWDGLRHEFYSNVFSRLVTPERTMEGTYFKSDERMTHYTVSNSKGSFIPETESQEEPTPAAGAPAASPSATTAPGGTATGAAADSAKTVTQPQRRPTAVKHAAKGNSSFNSQVTQP